jgi:hypothetical protein
MSAKTHLRRIVEQVPCGMCDAGTYDPVPLLRGLAMFGSRQSPEAARLVAPRCKSDGSHICWGAEDWISSMEFPISDDRIRSMMKLLAT